MSTSTNEIAPTSNEDRLRSILKQFDNPFGDSVYPQSSSPHLRAYHVPEHNSKIANTLKLAIDRFRKPIKSDTSFGYTEHPVTGVLLILGSRGDGKTHLLHETLLHPDFPGIVIAPTVLDSHRPFREYLLVQLIDHLLRQPQHRSQLVALSQWFARRVLWDSVRAMSEVEWLALDVLRSGSWLRRLSAVLWSRDKELDRQEVMRQLVESELPTIREICEDQRQPSAQVRLAALSHVHRLCPGKTPDQYLRRQIYLELVELAFDPGRGSIYELLIGGSWEPNSDQLDLKPSREILVDTSLGLLLQLFQLFERPVAFVFDALESLIGIPPERDRCEKFHSDLAQSMDQLPGLSFFIFSESTFWQQIQQYFQEYATHRFLRGMPIRGGGMEQTLVLERLDAIRLRKIVVARLAPVLANARREDPSLSICEISPFEESEITQIVDSGPGLRAAIQLLAKKYQERVFGDVKSPAPVEREIWSEQLQQARGECDAQLLQVSERLHSGLNDWLKLLIGSNVDVDGWHLVDATAVAFGENVRYGQIIKCDWKRETETCIIGIGLLLAGGVGMKADLNEKLVMMSSKKRPVERLIILWPRPGELETPCEDQLPAGTRTTWNDHGSITSGKTRRVSLRCISKTNLAPWLAWQPVMTAIREANVPVERLADYVIEQTASAGAPKDLRGYITPVETAE